MRVFDFLKSPFGKTSIPGFLSRYLTRVLFLGTRGAGKEVRLQWNFEVGGPRTCYEPPPLFIMTGHSESSRGTEMVGQTRSAWDEAFCKLAPFEEEGL